LIPHHVLLKFQSKIMLPSGRTFRDPTLPVTLPCNLFSRTVRVCCRLQPQQRALAYSGAKSAAKLRRWDEAHRTVGNIAKLLELL